MAVAVFSVFEGFLIPGLNSQENLKLSENLLLPKSIYKIPPLDRRCENSRFITHLLFPESYLFP